MKNSSRKQYDRERKKEQRKLNTDYANRIRIAKRSEKSKKRRNELRRRDCQKEKERIYAKEYRKRPDVKLKNSARGAVKWAIFTGVIIRPTCCEICGESDLKLKDGRSSLRADHFLGYEKENYLKVKFICIKCDGKQLRKHDI